jgi:putative SOS response-associated peptidase YedK
MCGRFALFASSEELRERYPSVDPSLFEQLYNIAPTQSVAAVRSRCEGAVGVSPLGFDPDGVAIIPSN